MRVVLVKMLATTAYQGTIQESRMIQIWHIWTVEGQVESETLAGRMGLGSPKLRVTSVAWLVVDRT